MKMNQALSAEQHKLVSSFESLRKQLGDEKYSDRLEKPLAYWALPGDRRLPLAFLGRSIKDLVATPFDELSSTPGIGQKKIGSLIKLLARATRDDQPAAPFGIDDLIDPMAKPVDPLVADKFDASVVSEALWSRWQESVRGAKIGYEKLGRLAPSLQDLPTVIWHTPLSAYLDHSVARMRNMKTHGEKRIRVILEVFCIAHQILGDRKQQDHLAVNLVPKFIPPIENWLNEALQRSELPTVAELHEKLVRPLIDQARVDTGDVIGDLAAGRLGIDSEPQSVRQQSREMGVTRARVYQLLDEIGRAMHVRWPEGRELLDQLAEQYAAEDSKSETARFFSTARELFFPRKTEGMSSLSGDQ